MSKKSEILDKLNRLKEISPSEGSSFFNPVINLVNAYYSQCSQYVANVDEAIDMMDVDIYRRNTHYEHDWDRKMPTNYPAGYFNFWECFYDFHEILEVGEESFVDAWVWEQDPQPEPQPEPSPEPLWHIKENTFLTHWSGVIRSWVETGSKTLDILIDWLKHSGGNYFLVSKFETRGKLISSKSRLEIAQIIYIDRHLKEVMLDLGIDGFMPSYIKNNQ